MSGPVCRLSRVGTAGAHPTFPTNSTKSTSCPLHPPPPSPARLQGQSESGSLNSARAWLGFGLAVLGVSCGIVVLVMTQVLAAAEQGLPDGLECAHASAALPVASYQSQCTSLRRTALEASFALLFHSCRLSDIWASVL